MSSPALPGAGGALHQRLAALAVGRVHGEAVVVFLALLDLHVAQADVGLDAPDAAVGGIVVDGDDGLAVLCGDLRRRHADGDGLGRILVGDDD